MQYAKNCRNQLFVDYFLDFGQKDPVPLRQLYPTSHPKATRLLEKMLKLNPNERISAVDILSDLYLNQFHDPSAEPVCPEPFAFDLDEQVCDMDNFYVIVFICEFMGFLGFRPPHLVMLK